MSSDDPTDESRDDATEDAVDDLSDELDETEAQRTARKRLEEGADRAVEEFDQSIVDLLAWLLDTETRARIYVYLRKHPNSTSEEVSEGTGLYPSTVREALAELHDESVVTRGKREHAGAGNNPYEYEAIAPSELVRGVVGQLQRELNTVFNLDRRLGGDETDDEPVTITVGDSEDDAFEGGEFEGGEFETEEREFDEFVDDAEAGDLAASDADEDTDDDDATEDRP
ncbi:helix-turn-helix domain-containing protein [Halegenticoccus tardaugens]|uniref:helix-turn-helix domain-containing protein n=1 Tax=Halegenticoccus tardaugens TaxID=2071624 RepID=UPI00100BF637|nr:helix-turn-helix domain-containing protein [Halegenticoccus tardaugens]